MELHVIVKPGSLVLPHFQWQEIACPCCGLVIHDFHALWCLQFFRNSLDRPVIVTSGTRCAKHNREVNGHPQSGHLLGRNFDVIVKGFDNATLDELANRAGFTHRLKYADGHFHLGV